MAGELTLAEIYAGYLTCLNRRDWTALGRFVTENVRHNDRPLGLSGYRQMLVDDVRAIPDLAFRAELLTLSPPILGCRLMFDCRPAGQFLDLPVNGRHVRFAEHVFYRFDQDRIAEVWSIIDRSAVAQQLADSGPA